MQFTKYIIKSIVSKRLIFSFYKLMLYARRGNTQ